MSKAVCPEVRALLNMRSIIIAVSLLLLLIAAGIRFAGYLRGDTAAAGSAVMVVVDIKGAVASPGLYELPQGSRVEDALPLAGLTADAAPELLNRAACLKDGSELIVPVSEGPVDWNALIERRGGDYYNLPAGGAEAAFGRPININTAAAGELLALSGIGEVKAAAIIAHREANGPFVTKEQIMNVTGIGAATYAKIEEQICVE
ncbi:MAG: ComEA family DNA-binding protein [Clostridia bacterium]|nr:ComEA family DNA-binding protein [Clostridia bacterium]